MSDIKYEEKFIVLNRKHFAELPRDISDNLISSINEANNYLPDRKYYVCNQDEPYADKVINIILEGEKDKLKE